MAERSGFFDAHLVNGEYDRVYLAENFARYFASFIGNGVFGGKSDELMVKQKTTADMSVNVFSGQGWINGYWYENDAELSLAIDVADGVLNRIDLIVLRWNNSERTIRLAIKKGTPASNPSAPILQRNADFYELKLAQIYVKAGATRITQIDITDTRLDEEVCGLVVGVVQQLDTEEFGKQLGAFVEQFMKDNQAWFTQFKTDSNSSVNTLLSTNQQRIDKLVSDGQTSINGVVTTGQQNIANVVSTGTTNINKLITDKTAEVNQVISTSQAKFNKLDTDSNAWFASFKTESENEVAALIAELEGLVNDNDLASLNAKIVNVTSRVVSLETSVSKFNALFVQSGQHPGCYYRLVTVTGATENEWINPPNEVGIEYRTTERWNGKPVYVKTIYLGVLSNKTMIAVTIDAEYDKVFFVSGYAFDPENNMSHPFPIILNGLTPIAVISGVEGNGSESNIIINVNEDLSAFSGYITVKYVKT